MPQVTYVEHGGARHTVEVPVGENVMRGALYNGVEGIVGECGGGLACATCHCYVEEAWAGKLEAPSEAELQMLESAVCEVKPNSRLSCQIALTGALDGLVVDLPEHQY
ncbi:MAG: 2Fe-2S iron-sulfur cluster binding domain-containing protein [Sphingomonadales bacterium]|nr:2Fe-2S iron-sulfur cluster binding domain-containing protein [Sphingomonadales bacterium]